jgi:GT2 family glycosyltransferase
VATPFVAVIDDDAEPADQDWLLRLYEHVARPGVACVGGQVVDPSTAGSEPARSAGRLSWYGRIAGNAGRRSDPEPVDLCALPEGNWAWRTDVLRDLAIDQIFDLGDASMYGCDLCLQAQKRGWRTLYVSDARIIHHAAPRDDSVLARDDRAAAVYGYTRNMTYIALTHFGWRRVPFAIWSTFVGDSAFLGVASALRETLLKRLTPGIVRASMRGRVDGVRSWRGARKRNPSSSSTQGPETVGERQREKH